MGVEKIKEHRYNGTTHQCKFLILWRGLEDVEDSLESHQDLLRDITVLIDENIAAYNATDLQDHITSA